MRILIGMVALIVSAAVSAAETAPRLYSTHAIVFDADTRQTLLEKNAKAVVPFASITKLLTAMVALDANPDLNEILSVSDEDVDRLKHTSSRIAIGTALSRQDMLHLALMSSENRAASALSRQYPGGYAAFIAAMNAKARQLGMANTHVEDPTGLSPNNQGSAEDLVRMVLAAERYEAIRQFTTSSGYLLPASTQTLTYRNTNRLIGNPEWNIELSKTGYTREAGRCIVMKLTASGKRLVIVLLGAPSSDARFADIFSIRRWIAGEPAQPALMATRRPSRPMMVAARLDAGGQAMKKSLRPAKYQVRKAKTKTRRV